MLIALALAASQPPETPPDPCPIFARLLAAARETPAFASVGQALANGEAIVPGFDAGDCRIDAAGGFECDLWSMGSHNFPDWREPVACPGITDVPGPRRSFNRYRALIAGNGLRIEYGVQCQGCVGNATSWFRVSFEGQGRPQE